MTHRVILESAFILHRRPYSDTSWILDIFSCRYGRLSVLVRSARGFQSRYKGQLDLFIPLLLSWSGRRSLKYLTQAEFGDLAPILEGEALLCAFYLNELLMRLLQPNDPYPVLFQTYHDILRRLSCPERQVALRCFEKKLLQEIGYGLLLQHEAGSQQPIDSKLFYCYFPDRGFMRSTQQQGNSIFSGESLLAVRDENFSTPTLLQDAKRLMRLALESVLGEKPLKSRELFRCLLRT